MSGLLIEGVWCRVDGLDLMVGAAGFRVSGFGFRGWVSGSRLRLGIQGSGFRVEGLGFRV